MENLNHSQGLHIRHKLNIGTEKKIGPYPVDGYDANTNTVYQFHGCYWHGHECWMTKNVKDQSPQQRIATYQQKRNGFSYFYCKRRDLDDGVSTVPLDLELWPIKKEPMDEEEQPMEVDHTETSMEVDTPVVVNDNDKYLIHLLKTNFENEK